MFVEDRGIYNGYAISWRSEEWDRIKDLEMEGMRISWDEMTCVGFPVTDKAVEKLCRDIMKFREKADLPKWTVTKEQLINWKVLKEEEGTTLSTNAFALLTSDHFFFSKTQCAVFKGTGRSVFLDKREYTGPLYEQVEEAVDFVLRNIRLGATIQGLLRHEEYELPVEAIREMIVNAHCHRNMLDESCVQVAIYDDRLEVTSPGGLYNGLTYAQMMNGRSKLRNRAVANVFNQMGLIDAWGTSVKRIKDAASEYGLREPEFIEMDDTFRINLYRNTSGANIDANGANIDANDANGANGANTGVDQTNENDSVKLRILEELKKEPEITQQELSSRVGVSRRTLQRIMKKTTDENLITRIGSTRGYWQVND